jgi:hypothetical protein
LKSDFVASWSNFVARVTPALYQELSRPEVNVANHGNAESNNCLLCMDMFITKTAKSI